MEEKIKYNPLWEALSNNLKAKELTILIQELRKEGVLVDIITSTIILFCENNQLSVNRIDMLDDIVAALEGDCSRDYILHPSNFKTS